MAPKLIKTRRDFPAVEALLQAPELAQALSQLPRPVAAAIVKKVVGNLKQELAVGGKPLTRAALFSTINQELAVEASAQTTGVINATGIVVHTNLGRAPLAESILKEVPKAVAGYGNIEFDLTTGKRGQRGAACERYLSMLSGAEAATVVNNNAAALFLILNTLANRRKVIISRGELIQIGGGFRIPDILRRSGAKLSEVGTTNITTLADYEKGINHQTTLILKVHKSNFIQAGFTDEVELKELVALGRKHSIPVINDQGSGVLVPTAKVLGYREPTVQESVRAGATLTCFSGDKMLGGMQSGLIVGQADTVKRIKKNPIFRTVRVDKIVFASLEKLLTSYLNGTHIDDIKLWQLLTRPMSELRQMAVDVLESAGRPKGVTVEEVSAYVGGGAMPERALASIGLVFSSAYSATRLLKTFRGWRGTPIIGRIEEDRLILDLKAVDHESLPILAKAVRELVK